MDADVDSFEPRRPRSQVSPRTIWTIGLNGLLMLGTLAVVRETWTVISWILIAIFIALALDPLVRWLSTRLRIRRGFALMIVLALVLGGCALFVIEFAPMLVEQGKKLAASSPELAQRLQENRSFRWADEHLHLSDAAARFTQRITAGPAMAVAGKIFQGVAATVTITSLTIFALLFGGELFRGLLSWFEPARRQHLKLLARRMHRRVGGYVSGTLLVACITGGVIATTLAVIGNPYFLPLGLVMIVLGVIPWAGSALGELLVVSTTFAAQGGKQAAIVLGIFLVYQQVEHHLLQPMIQRRTIKMNPLLIAIVMLIGTDLTGLLGTLLALPVAGATQVVLEDVRRRQKEKWRRAKLERQLEDERQLPLFGADSDREQRPMLPH